MASLAGTAARISWRQQPLNPSTTSSTIAPNRFFTSLRPRQPQIPRHQRRHNSSRTTEPVKPQTTPTPPPATGNATAAGAAGEGTSKAAQRAAKEARRRATAERIANSSLRFMPGFIGRRLRGPLEGMVRSPGSHVVSFLIIHEITAILPLFGFMSLFVYMDWVPTAWVAGPWAGWALEGVRKYAGYFRKKGWFGMGGADGVEGGKKLEGELEEEVQHQQQHPSSSSSPSSARGESGAAPILDAQKADKDKKKAGWFGFSSKKSADDADNKSSAVEAHEEAKAKDRSTASKVATTTWHAVKKVVTFDNIDTGYKTSIQFAAAYAITKMLLPARLALSVWLTPSGARVFSRMWRAVRGGASPAK